MKPNGDRSFQRFYESAKWNQTPLPSQHQARPYLSAALKRRLSFYRQAEIINVDWMLSNGLAGTAKSARQMLYRDVQVNILTSHHTWQSTFYELKEREEKRKRRKYVTYAVASAVPHSTSCTNTSFAPDYLKYNNETIEFGKVCSISEHLIQDRRQIEGRFRVNLRRRQRHMLKGSAWLPDSTPFVKPSPDCCKCKGAWICPACHRLLTAPVTAATLLRRSAGYGIWGRVWADSAVLDALDVLRTGIAPRVHRLYFRFHDERGAFSREFEMQTAHNKRIDIDIEVNGTIAHIERYKTGMTIVKCKMTNTPILPQQVTEFKQAIMSELPPEIEAPASETWQTVATDLGYDLPTKETCRRSHTAKYAGIKLHAYNKRIAGSRYLRLEAQFNPGTTNDADYFDRIANADAILLESCGMKPKFIALGEA